PTSHDSTSDSWPISRGSRITETCLLALLVLAGDRLGLLERVGLGCFGVVTHPVDLDFFVVGLGESVLILLVGVRLGHLVALHSNGPTRFRARPQHRAPGGLWRPPAASADPCGLALREDEPVGGRVDHDRVTV